MKTSCFAEIVATQDAFRRRESLAAWALDVLDRAPAFRYGAGRQLQADEKQAITNDAAAEILAVDLRGQMPAPRKILDSVAPGDAEGALRCALWNRAAQLVAQHCAGLDPEWKNARRRVGSFLKAESQLHRLICFSAFGVRFVCFQHSSDSRHKPAIPRDELERRFIVPDECLRFGEGLGEFICQMLTDLEAGGDYRPWLSVDDLAFVLARAQERRQSEAWMREAPPIEPDAVDHEVAAAFEQARVATLQWFEGQYAPRKNYDESLRVGLRTALEDHVRILTEDTGNHPGLAALLCFHLPHLTPSSYRNSSLRSDFEYMIRRFTSELKLAAGPILEG